MTTVSREQMIATMTLLGWWPSTIWTGLLVSHTGWEYLDHSSPTPTLFKWTFQYPLKLGDWDKREDDNVRALYETLMRYLSYTCSY